MNQEIVEMVDQLERALPEDRHEHVVTLPGGRVVQILRVRTGERPDINSTEGR